MCASCSPGPSCGCYKMKAVKYVAAHAYAACALPSLHPSQLPNHRPTVAKPPPNHRQTAAHCLPICPPDAAHRLLTIKPNCRPTAAELPPLQVQAALLPMLTITLQYFAADESPQHSASLDDIVRALLDLEANSVRNWRLRVSVCTCVFMIYLYICNLHTILRSTSWSSGWTCLHACMPCLGIPFIGSTI